MGMGTGGGAPRGMAPSIAKADFAGWARASACAGMAAGLLALALLWRMGSPPMSLADALGCSAAGALRALSRLFFSARAGECSAAWASLPAWARFGMLARASAAAMCACVPGALCWRGWMSPGDGLVHVRGPRLHAGRRALAAAKAKFGPGAARMPDHEIAPGVPFGAGMWTKHVVIAGGTGAGKSTLMRALLGKVFAAGEHALVFDPKGEYTALFPQAAILAPWDARTWAWDIGKDMRNVADMRRFAESVVEQSSDPMWSNASRMLLVGCMSALRERSGDGWGFGELAEAIASRQPELAKMMAKSMREAAPLVEKPTVTTQGILINLAAASAPIFDLACAWGRVPPGRRLSMVDWALGRGGPKQIVMQGDASYGPLTRSFARPVVECVAALASSPEMEDDEARKRWLVCDELPSLGKVDIRLAVNQGRSKGYRCVFACQDFAQLEEIHGEAMVRALMSMVGTVVVGRTGPGSAARMICEAVGSREVERPNVSVSKGGHGAGRSESLSFSREQVPIYLPAELSSRLGADPKGRGMVMALVADGDVYELLWPHVNLPKLRPQSVPAEWTKGALPSQSGKPGRGPIQSSEGGGDAVGGGRDGEGAGLPAAFAMPSILEGVELAMPSIVAGAPMEAAGPDGGGDGDSEAGGEGGLGLGEGDGDGDEDGERSMG